MRVGQSTQEARASERAQGPSGAGQSALLDTLAGAPSADVAGLGVKLHAVSTSQLRHIEHALYMRQEKETLDRIIKSIGE